MYAFQYPGRRRFTMRFFGVAFITLLSVATFFPIVSCSSHTTAGDSTDASANNVDEGVPCPPLDDAAAHGVQTLDELHALCGPFHSVQQWVKECAGLDVVIAGNDDCASVFLFDPTSRQLKATGRVCNIGVFQCTSEATAFRFPDECFVADASRPDFGPQVCGDAGAQDASSSSD